MITSYLVVKLLHVLLAIFSLGFTSTFGLIMAFAVPTPQNVPFALQIIARLEKVARPCFLGLLVTGILMAHLGNLQWTTLWFSLSLGLMAVAITLASAVAAPTLQKQLALVAQPGPPTPERVSELQALGGKSRKVGMVLGLLGLTMICLMIFKPTL